MTHGGHRAQKEWLLKILASLNDKHEVFGLNYRPKKKAIVVNGVSAEVKVANESDFFEGLSSKHGIRVNRRLFVSKEDDVENKKLMLKAK